MSEGEGGGIGDQLRSMLTNQAFQNLALGQLHSALINGLASLRERVQHHRANDWQTFEEARAELAELPPDQRQQEVEALLDGLFVRWMRVLVHYHAGVEGMEGSAVDEKTKELGVYLHNPVFQAAIAEVVADEYEDLAMGTLDNIGRHTWGWAEAGASVRGRDSDEYIDFYATVMGADADEVRERVYADEGMAPNESRVPPED